MSITAKQIAKIVAYLDSPFNLKKNEAVIENVSHGFFSWGEADIVAITKAGYIIEGEIKISKNDILADAKKYKWTEDGQKAWARDIKNFYYIVPEELVEFAMEKTSRAVIGVRFTETGRMVSRIARQAQTWSGRKLFLEERNKLLRLGCFRAWRE